MLCAVIFLSQIQDMTCGSPMHEMYQHMVKQGIENVLSQSMPK